MKRVNTFLLCPPKSGSTSLYMYLKSHPEVYMCPVKEPNYFATDIDVGSFRKSFAADSFVDFDKYLSEKPLQEQQIAFVRDEEVYNSLLDDAGEKQIIGEASTSYLRSKEAAKNIYAYNKESKFIVILRHPINRAYSHYCMDVRFGYERKPFSEAITSDMKKDPKGRGVNAMYYDLGLYAQQIERYFSYFPKEQFYITTSKRLQSDTTKVLSEIQQFIGIKQYNLNEDSKRYNTGVVPVHGIVSKIYGLAVVKRIIAILPKALLKRIKACLFKKPRKITEQERSFMAGLYAKEIESLKDLVSIDFNETH